MCVSGVRQFRYCNKNLKFSKFFNFQTWKRDSKIFLSRSSNTKGTHIHTQIQISIITINICTGHRRFEGEVEVVAKETAKSVEKKNREEVWKETRQIEEIVTNCIM